MRSIAAPATGLVTTATPVTSPDDETGNAEVEAPPVVQVDDLEREDGAVPEHVEEDADLDDPHLAREAEGQPVHRPFLRTPRQVDPGEAERTADGGEPRRRLTE